MESRILRAIRASTHCRLRSGWRSFVACAALVSLAWPSLGPLPWLAVAEAHHGLTHQDARVDADANDRDYASDVPGSPTHPTDHNCFECQVLKHLARCVLSQPPAPDAALSAGRAVQPEARVESQHARHVALLPPVRAPPLRSA